VTLSLTEMPVPGGPADLTPQWMTAALQTSLPDHPAVVALDWESVGSGLGFTGQVARVALSYAGGATPEPARVIAKFAAPPGSARDLLSEFGGYVREMRFYAELAEEAGLPTPRCYYAAYDEATGNIVLLLEDMAPSKVGDQVEGATAEEAEFVVTELARFHARWWNSERLLDHSWLRPSARLAERLDELYRRGLGPLRETMQGRYPELLDLVERMGAIVPALAASRAALLPRPFTLVHGDVRLDNLFLPLNGNTSFAVIDWQATAIGSAANDLAYWLVLSLPVDVRRAHEPRLLRRYHSVLVENEVEGYSLRRLRREYANGILVQLAGLPVLASNLDFSSDRGQALATAALERLDAGARDLKAARTIRILTWLVQLQGLARAIRAPFRRFRR
jgi:hypothetical protein